MKKLIKKLVKTYFQKYVGQEMTAFDNRIYKLECKVGVTELKADLASICVDNAEHIKAETTEVSPGVFVPKGTLVANPPLAELPKKWCVKITEEHKCNLKAYWLKLPKVDSSYIFQDWLISDKRSDNSYLIYNKDSLTAWGYTEISFSDFERLVLKKEQSNNIGQLEVGKWYHYNDWLLCHTKLSDDNLIMAYGFCDKREWYGEARFGQTPKEWKQASGVEVETTLINEAKRRGLKTGVKVKIRKIGSDYAEYVLTKTINYLEWSYNSDHDVLRFRNQIVYDKGEWAEIIQQPKETEIDWEYPGNFLRNKYDVILVTTGHQDNDMFEGTVVHDKPKMYGVGHFSKQWLKQDFMIFSGAVQVGNQTISKD